MYRFQRWLDRCIEYARAMLGDPSRSEEDRLEIEAYLAALQEIRELLPARELAVERFRGAAASSGATSSPGVPPVRGPGGSDLAEVKAWLSRIVAQADTGGEGDPGASGRSGPSASGRRSSAYIQAAKDALEFLERAEEVAPQRQEGAS